MARHKTTFVTLHSSSYLLKIMESKELLAICRIRPLAPVSPIHFSGSQITGLSNNSYKSLTKIPHNFWSSRCAIFFNEWTQLSLRAKGQILLQGAFLLCHMHHNSLGIPVSNFKPKITTVFVLDSKTQLNFSLCCYLIIQALFLCFT